MFSLGQRNRRPVGPQITGDNLSCRIRLNDMVDVHGASYNGTCLQHVPVSAMIEEEEAIGLLADGLRTPLQIEQHLNLALDHGIRSGVKPITAEAVETVLFRQLDELEPRFTRHGYNVKSLATQFHTKPAEIRQFLRGAFNEQRTHELTEQMRAAGARRYDRAWDQRPCQGPVSGPLWLTYRRFVIRVDSQKGWSEGRTIAVRLS